MESDKRRFYTYFGAKGVLCNNCKHRHQGVHVPPICDIYPDGIPTEVIDRSATVSDKSCEKFEEKYKKEKI